MSVTSLVDEAVAGRVLVFGSLPPEGRDLDLLARPAEERVIATRLGAEGFLRRGSQWVRFAGCSVESVDLAPVSRWRLPTAEIDALFDEARAVEGMSQLVRPAPHHSVLILARRVARDRGVLDLKRRARLEQALAEDPGAWDLAEDRAGLWRARSALSLLRSAWRDGGSTPARARVAGWRGLVRRRPRGRVVSLSGLDGSGKTSLAEALQDILVRLGHDAVVEWTRLSAHPSLESIARPVKRVVETLPRPSSRRAENEEATASGAVPSHPSAWADPGKELRRRSALITYVWATIVALANASWHRRSTRPHLKAGRIVICDRYELDSAVHLRYRYGEARTFGFQKWLIHAISPKPLRAFWLDVRPEVALERKTEQYDLEQLAVQAALYREEGRSLRVRRLDGERPREELCEEIGREVWLALG